MKILLTGPTGFVGSAFTRAALDAGHHVAGLVIPSESIPAHIPPHKNLVWFRGTLDEAPWDQIAAYQPDVCLHAAWITTPGVYLESPDNERFRDSSLVFLRKIHELGTNHILGLGTCIEYKITGAPLSERTTPIEPTTTYSRCKDELRLAMEAEARKHAFTFCWGRVFYPYGPREHPARLCSSIISKLASNETIVLKTPASTKDYIYIDDLASALLAVLASKTSGAINLGTGLGIAVRDLARCLAELMGKPELVKEKEPPDIDPAGYVVADISRLHSLGWKPRFSLRQGLQALVQARRSPPAQL